MTSEKTTEANRFLEAMRPLEDEFGAVDPGSDNTLLFTATKLMVLKGLDEDEAIMEAARCAYVFVEREFEPGVYRRHPAETWPSSWDDHMACAIYGYLFDFATSIRILLHGETSGWVWGTNWLGRMPLFVGVVTHCGGDKLSPWNQLQVVSAYIANLWAPRNDESGRRLLWLASFAFKGSSYWVIALAISIWNFWMSKLYQAGPKEMLGGYHGASHPFAVYGPSEWGVV